eukprot:CAMPEP_0119304454 /NCGR_PEP_ID=MMETSP1333-20130426/5669_1 /TAXON_ID=418940 /ORGANISM="Scyphosphaera apsteinii, Strain RCC1455" /LENGTH=695 /DNA_ID=CAMNT_0007307347 /DNA_START=166 /DNA_END=2250 /DNA_ORIENTATION=+
MMLLVLCLLGVAAATSAQYEVEACVALSMQHNCELQPLSVKLTKQPVKRGHNGAAKCEDTVDQWGSVAWSDLTLPEGRALMVKVITSVPGLSSASGFFVRPTRRTRNWPKPRLTARTATFYLADTGQFSVEFAPPSLWREKAALSFDALMLFVNPELALPDGLTTISPKPTKALSIDLGPNKAYVFTKANTYDWGRDIVFKVHDNTRVYFEAGAHVRARIVQTEKKVDNVLISGYGTLDTHYELEPDIVGISDDATQQTIGIYGKNIRVFGVTIINTNPRCGTWGYCLNINANWSPIGDPKDPFGADELQDQKLPSPKYKRRQAHCQLTNMDNSPNTNFENCPTSHADGQRVSFVKCMTWQMGQDGLNAGKWGAVENSFVRVIDDAIKPWDSHGVYTNITIWQQALGWPINLGWWSWVQPDIGTVLEDIYVIHNHNWHTSGGWPETKSGQCTIGAIYGSGSVKKGYKLKNIFVETAASCAVGLEISKSAYNRHPTAKGCVGSIIDLEIDGLFFDEEFKTGKGYGNFISGEANPMAGCVGDLNGKVKGMTISSNVAGRALTESDFQLPAPSTVPGLVLTAAVDPHAVSEAAYKRHARKNAYVGNGASAEIDQYGVVVRGVEQCLERCHADWSCDCVVFATGGSNAGTCWKRRGCEVPGAFDDDKQYDVYVRSWEFKSCPQFKQNDLWILLKHGRQL